MNCLVFGLRLLAGVVLAVLGYGLAFKAYAWLVRDLRIGHLVSISREEAPLSFWCWWTLYFAVATIVALVTTWLVLGLVTGVWLFGD